MDRTVGLSADLKSYSLQRTKTEWEENLKPENTEEGKRKDELVVCPTRVSQSHRWMS